MICATTRLRKLLWFDNITYRGAGLVLVNAKARRSRPRDQLNQRGFIGCRTDRKRRAGLRNCGEGGAGLQIGFGVAPQRR
jgi:hypothetical protein